MKSSNSWVVAGKLGFTALAILLSLRSPANATFPEEVPNPMSLLRGVEEARAAISAGRIDWTVKHQDSMQPQAGVHIRRVEVAMDGLKRRFDQYERVLMIDGTKPGAKDADRELKARGGDEEAFVRAGLGEFKHVHIGSAFDGERYMQYSKDLGAYILDPHKGSIEYLFDPRVYGLTFWYTLDDTVTGILGYREAKSVATISREVVGERSAWHVLVIDKSDRERHFWIDPSDFRVLKSEIRSRFSKTTSDCTFDDHSAYPQLPTEVILRAYDRNQKLRSTTTFHVDRAVVGSVDSAGWTLAGLGMPLGQSMFDNRIRKDAGNFDGRGLTEGVIPAIEKGRALENRKMTWLFVLVGLIGLAVVAAILVKKRNLLREGEA